MVVIVIGEALVVMMVIAVGEMVVVVMAVAMIVVMYDWMIDLGSFPSSPLLDFIKSLRL